MPAAVTHPALVARDPYVLHGRPLIEGVALSETSRFSEDVWALGPAVMQRSGRSQSLYFANIPVEHRADVKLLCYTALSGEIPHDEDRPGIATVLSMQNRIRHVANWLSEHRPGLAFADMQVSDLDDFQTYLATNVRPVWQRYALRTAVAFLWRYRTSLGSRALTFDPRLTDYWTAEPYPGKRTENATSRIPETVHAPLLVWSMRFVDDFADDILNGIDLWRVRRHKGTVGDELSGRRALRWGQAQTLIREYLARARDAGKPLPGSNGRPNIAAIGRAVGCDRLALEPFSGELAELARAPGSGTSCSILPARARQPIATT